jgi:hypothetical protein
VHAAWGLTLSNFLPSLLVLKLKLKYLLAVVFSLSKDKLTTFKKYNKK